MNEEIKPITEYIRENRHLYTREAIDRQLAEAGYKTEDVAATWGLVGEVPPVKAPEPVRDEEPRFRDLMGRRDFRLAVAGYVAVFYIGTAIAAFALPEPIAQKAAPTIITVILGAGVVSNSILRYRRINYAAGQGILVGMAVAVILIPGCLFAALFGYCIATGYSGLF